MSGVFFTETVFRLVLRVLDTIRFDVPGPASNETGRWVPTFPSDRSDPTGNIGPAQLLIIALILLLIFGAGRIAEIGKSLGSGLRIFKKGLSDDDESDELTTRPDR